MNVYNLTILDKESIPLEEIHFSTENKQVLDQLLKEFKHIEVLQQYNLSVDNKILLFGHTGCGKTTTAKAIAKALNKKIFILNLGSIVSSKLGETAQNITAVFEKAAIEKAVLFIDEFDYIGKMRDYDAKDNGEMKRLVNTIIQRIDYFSNDALLIAATNHSHVIDGAILRRFQLKLKFEMPDRQQLDTYYNALLSQYPEKYRSINRIYEISYAEAQDIVHRAVKFLVIEEHEVNAKEKEGVIK